MQLPQTGYRWQGHFSSVHLLHLCRVFLLLMLGHSTQRTKAPLLFSNNVSGVPGKNTQVTQHTKLVTVGEIHSK